MNEIQHYFSTNQVESSDSDLWEVVTPGGERVASCSTEETARELERSLNLALSDWHDEDPEDREVEC
jgi:hypothetical protein